MPPVYPQSPQIPAYLLLQCAALSSSLDGFGLVLPSPFSGPTLDEPKWRDGSRLRILVGLGGTAFTSVAIRRTVELARIHAARVTAVTVVDAKRLDHSGPVPLGGATAAYEQREQRSQVTAAAIGKAIGAFEAACGAAGVKYSVRQERGDPSPLLAARGD